MKKLVMWILLVLYLYPGALLIEERRQQKGYLSTSFILGSPIILMIGPFIKLEKLSQTLPDMKWFEITEETEND